jgi:23S rRNA (uracil1939-C5)-methyltransferase
MLVETTIEDLAERDLCFGKLGGGLAVFVQGPVAVGDRVRAEVLSVRKNHVRSRVVEILEPSPCRIPPTCAHFGACGGCKWQHVEYAEQLRLKRKHVTDALAHIGGMPEALVEDVLPAERIYGYRNKIEFSFSRQRYLLPSERGLAEIDLDKPTDFALGFHAPRLFAKVVDVDTCHIATPEMNTVLAGVKHFSRDRGLSIYSTQTHDGLLRQVVVRQAAATEQLMVNLVTSEHDASLMAEWRDLLLRELGDRLTTFVNNITTAKNNSSVGQREYVLHGPGVIEDRIGEFSYVISANSFFQTNTAQAERLYRRTLELAAPRPSDVLYDLYCGTGSISLYAASRCDRVLGLEWAESAVADARANAERNGVTNVEFTRIDLKHVKSLQPDLDAFGVPDVVIVDPPRAGVHPKAVEVLLQWNPRRIVYVSCNPSSLARDVKALCESGSYNLGPVTPVDMFPHTNHIESVARLDRGS